MQTNSWEFTITPDDGTGITTDQAREACRQIGWTLEEWDINLSVGLATVTDADVDGLMDRGYVEHNVLVDGRELQVDAEF